MTEKYYARAWTRGDTVYTLNTNSGPITFDTFTGWSDFIIDFEIYGPYTDAGIILPQLSYGPSGLTSDTLSIVVTGTRPGIPA